MRKTGTAMEGLLEKRLRRSERGTENTSKTKGSVYRISSASKVKK